MKQLVATFGLTVLLAVPAEGVLREFTTSDPPISIPDNTGTFTACQTITATATGEIVEIWLEFVAVSHTFVGDLTFRLASPFGTNLTLVNRPGRTGSGAGDSSNLSSDNPIHFDGDYAPGDAELMGTEPGCDTNGVIGTSGCGPAVRQPNPDAADTPIPGVGTNLHQWDGESSAAGVWTLCIADSAAGDTGTLVSWSLRVQDVGNLCLIGTPDDIATSNDAGQCGAVVTFDPPPTKGTCDVGCTPASGSLFPVGTTTVTCDAVFPDESANGAISFDVTVTDTEAPTVTAPDLVVGNDPGACSAVVSYSPTGSDNCAATPVCTPPSGSTFPVGVTGVSCTVVDAAGNQGSDAGSVTVNDVEPPAIVCPADIVLEVPFDSTGEAVLFADPAASDNCAVDAVACVPPSGSIFPVDTTPVGCTASDPAGNSASCGFDVTLFAGEPTSSVLEVPALSGRGLAGLALGLLALGLHALRRKGSAGG